MLFLCRVREAAKKGGPGHCLYTQTQPPQVPTTPQLISPLAQDICFALISIFKLIEIFLHGLIPWFSQLPPLDLPSLSGWATTKIHIFWWLPLVTNLEKLLYLVEGADEGVPLVEPHQRVHAPLQLREPQVQRRHTEQSRR